MSNRLTGFTSLLAVVGVSIVFGMLLGGKLNAPQVMLAAPASEPPIRLAAAVNGPGFGDFADIVESAMPAVVSVTAKKLADRPGERPRGQREDPLWQWFFGPQEPDSRPGPRSQPSIGEGSGFIISADGYVLTNNHVIEDADQVQVGLQGGQQVTAEVIGADPSIDLALLKIEGQDRLPTLPLGNSKNLRVGEWVIAIGNPLDYEQTVTVGVVSAKERRVPIGNTDSGVVSFIQTDAAINFGNSGGPLLDGRGNVIGINTAIRRANYAEGIGFALPIQQALGVIDQLRQRGYVKRGYIGITMNSDGIDDAAREYYGLPDPNGVLVDRVADDGPAARGGLRKGDIVRKVDGEPVRDNLDLISKISARQPGDEVRLEVFRDGKTVRLRVTLGDREEGLRADAGTERPDSPERGDRPEETSTGLGFTVENLGRRMRERLSLDESQRGVVVTDVDFESQAADKGILPNMVVTGVNDEPIRSVSDWIEVMDSLRPGSPVKLDLLAGQRSFSVFLRAPRAEE